MKPTYEGLKDNTPDVELWGVADLKPTYEGLKAFYGQEGDTITPDLKPTYEGLKEVWDWVKIFTDIVFEAYL